GAVQIFGTDPEGEFGRYESLVEELGQERYAGEIAALAKKIGGDFRKVRDLDRVGQNLRRHAYLEYERYHYDSDKLAYLAERAVQYQGAAGKFKLYYFYGEIPMGSGDKDQEVFDWLSNNFLYPLGADIFFGVQSMVVEKFRYNTGEIGDLMRRLLTDKFLEERAMDMLARLQGKVPLIENLKVPEEKLREMAALYEKIRAMVTEEARSRKRAIEIELTGIDRGDPDLTPEENQEVIRNVQEMFVRRFIHEQLDDLIRLRNYGERYQEKMAQDVFERLEALKASGHSDVLTEREEKMGSRAVPQVSVYEINGFITNLYENGASYDEIARELENWFQFMRSINFWARDGLGHFLAFPQIDYLYKFYGMDFGLEGKIRIPVAGSKEPVEIAAWKVYGPDDRIETRARGKVRVLGMELLEVEKIYSYDFMLRKLDPAGEILRQSAIALDLAFGRVDAGLLDVLVATYKTVGKETEVEYAAFKAAVEELAGYLGEVKDRLSAEVLRRQTEGHLDPDRQPELAAAMGRLITEIARENFEDILRAKVIELRSWNRMMAYRNNEEFKRMATGRWKTEKSVALLRHEVQRLRRQVDYAARLPKEDERARATAEALRKLQELLARMESEVHAYFIKPEVQFVPDTSLERYVAEHRFVTNRPVDEIIEYTHRERILTSKNPPEDRHTPLNMQAMDDYHIWRFYESLFYHSRLSSKPRGVTEAFRNSILPAPFSSDFRNLFNYLRQSGWAEDAYPEPANAAQTAALRTIRTIQRELGLSFPEIHELAVRRLASSDESSLRAYITDMRYRGWDRNYIRLLLLYRTYVKKLIEESGTYVRLGERAKIDQIAESIVHNVLRDGTLPLRAAGLELDDEIAARLAEDVRAHLERRGNGSRLVEPTKGHYLLRTLATADDARDDETTILEKIKPGEMARRMGIFRKIEFDTVVERGRSATERTSAWLVSVSAAHHLPGLANLLPDPFSAKGLAFYRSFQALSEEVSAIEDDEELSEVERPRKVQAAIGAFRPKLAALLGNPGALAGLNEPEWTGAVTKILEAGLYVKPSVEIPEMLPSALSEREQRMARRMREDSYGKEWIHSLTQIAMNTALGRQYGAPLQSEEAFYPVWKPDPQRAVETAKAQEITGPDVPANPVDVRRWIQDNWGGDAVEFLKSQPEPYRRLHNLLLVQMQNFLKQLVTLYPKARHAYPKITHLMVLQLVSNFQRNGVLPSRLQEFNDNTLDLYDVLRTVEAARTRSAERAEAAFAELGLGFDRSAFARLLDMQEKYAVDSGDHEGWVEFEDAVLQKLVPGDDPAKRERALRQVLSILDEEYSIDVRRRLKIHFMMLGPKEPSERQKPLDDLFLYLCLNATQRPNRIPQILPIWGFNSQDTLAFKEATEPRGRLKDGIDAVSSSLIRETVGMHWRTRSHIVGQTLVEALQRLGYDTTNLEGELGWQPIGATAVDRGNFVRTIIAMTESDLIVPGDDALPEDERNALFITRPSGTLGTDEAGLSAVSIPASLWRRLEESKKSAMANGDLTMEEVREQFSAQDLAQVRSLELGALLFGKAIDDRTMPLAGKVAVVAAAAATAWKIFGWLRPASSEEGGRSEMRLSQRDLSTALDESLRTIRAESRTQALFTYAATKLAAAALVWMFNSHTHILTLLGAPWWAIGAILAVFLFASLIYAAWFEFHFKAKAGGPEAEGKIARGMTHFDTAVRRWFADPLKRLRIYADSSRLMGRLVMPAIIAGGFLALASHTAALSGQALSTGQILTGLGAWVGGAILSHPAVWVAVIGSFLILKFYLLKKSQASPWAIALMVGTLFAPMIFPALGFAEFTHFGILFGALKIVAVYTAFTVFVAKEKRAQVVRFGAVSFIALQGLNLALGAWLGFSFGFLAVAVASALMTLTAYAAINPGAMAKRSLFYAAIVLFLGASSVFHLWAVYGLLTLFLFYWWAGNLFSGLTIKFFWKTFFAAYHGVPTAHVILDGSLAAVASVLFFVVGVPLPYLLVGAVVLKALQTAAYVLFGYLEHRKEGALRQLLETAEHEDAQALRAMIADEKPPQPILAKFLPAIDAGLLLAILPILSAGQPFAVFLMLAAFFAVKAVSVHWLSRTKSVAPYTEWKLMSGVRGSMLNWMVASTSLLFTGVYIFATLQVGLSSPLLLAFSAFMFTYANFVAGDILSALLVKTTLQIPSALPRQNGFAVILDTVTVLGIAGLWFAAPVNFVFAGIALAVAAKLTAWFISGVRIMTSEDPVARRSEIGYLGWELFHAAALGIGYLSGGMSLGLVLIIFTVYKVFQLLATFGRHPAHDIPRDELTEEFERTPGQAQTSQLTITRTGGGSSAIKYAETPLSSGMQNNVGISEVGPGEVADFTTADGRRFRMLGSDHYSNIWLSDTVANKQNVPQVKGEIFFRLLQRARYGVDRVMYALHNYSSMRAIPLAKAGLYNYVISHIMGFDTRMIWTELEDDQQYQVRSQKVTWFPVSRDSTGAYHHGYLAQPGHYSIDERRALHYEDRAGRPHVLEFGMYRIDTSRNKGAIFTHVFWDGPAVEGVYSAEYLGKTGVKASEEEARSKAVTLQDVRPIPQGKVRAVPDAEKDKLVDFVLETMTLKEYQDMMHLAGGAFPVDYGNISDPDTHTELLDKGKYQIDPMNDRLGDIENRGEGFETTTRSGRPLPRLASPQIRQFLFIKDPETGDILKRVVLMRDGR
ncbi:MAG: DMT family transporter, partial [Candidatus Omnitrophota bacterium]